MHVLCAPLLILSTSPVSVSLLPASLHVRTVPAATILPSPWSETIDRIELPEEVGLNLSSGTKSSIDAPVGVVPCKRKVNLGRDRFNGLSPDYESAVRLDNDRSGNIIVPAKIGDDLTARTKRCVQRSVCVVARCQEVRSGSGPRYPLRSRDQNSAVRLECDRRGTVVT